MKVPDAIAVELEHLISAGPAVIVGTCDRHGVPEISRGWGVHFSAIEQILDICVYHQQGHRTLANLAVNRQAAVTIVGPNTYRGFQFKGRVIELEAAKTAQISRAMDHKRAFIDAVANVGLTEEMTSRLYLTEMGDTPELVALRIQVEELFDQTPGPDAGARL